MINIAISINKCDSGGQKSLVMAYLRNLDSNKVNFQLFCDADSNSIPYDEIIALGGKLHIVPPYQKIFSHLKALNKLFQENNFDVLYACNNTMNIFPLFIAYINGVKVRVSESLTMASKLEKKKTLLKSILKQFSHFFCNYYMANGKDCGIYQFGQKAFNEGKISIFLTPVDAKANTYNSKLRVETRKIFGWENKVIFGFIGRFELQKNPIFLIDVMFEISNKCKNAHFVIIGFGSLEKKILERISGYKMENQVDFLGRREDIKQFYNAFDAFILPSLYEGLPVVGIEAQASGLPVFFSENITKEAAVAELGHFISLRNSAEVWADEIIRVTEMSIPTRRGREDDLRKAGFDSEVEANRLLIFFENAVKEQNI